MRWGLVPSALVIGSMMPDLPYFIGRGISDHETHTLTGALTLDVLLGGIAFLVWQALLAPPAVALAPAGIRARLDPRLPLEPLAHLRTVRGVVVVAVSLALGALTHVAWDAFTHANGWGVARVDWLARQYGPLAAHRWAQYLSGVLGAVAIIVWVARWYRDTPPRAAVRRITPLSPGTALVVWLGLVLVALGGAVIGGFRPLLRRGGPDWSEVGVDAVTRAGSAVGVTILVLSIVWVVHDRMLRARRQVP
jgi:hypothetical protein